MWKSLFGPIGFLLILAFLHNFALTNFEGIFGLYAQKRYDFDPPTIGLIMTVAGLVSAIVQGILTGPATRRFGDVKRHQGFLVRQYLRISSHAGRAQPGLGAGHERILRL